MAFNRMDKLGFAMAIGIVSGLSILLMPLILIIKGISDQYSSDIHGYYYKDHE